MLRPETVDRAFAAIQKGYAQYRYFFEQVDSPAWLEPLFEKGIFNFPEPMEAVGDAVRLPLWPASQYLIRMCQFPTAHPTIAKIARSIPATDNSSVYDDILEIALLLPPDLGVSLEQKISEGILLPVKINFKYVLADLIIKLAGGGQADAARRLLRKALTLKADPNATNTDDKPLLFPTPQAQFDDWHYGEITSKTLPAIVDAIGIKAVALFSAILNDAIRYSRKGSSETQANEVVEDFIYISHPMIENNKGRDRIVNILLTAVRDASERVIARDSTQFVPVIQVLDQRNWTSFRRVKMHLCRIFPEQGFPTAEAMFLAPELLNNAGYQHEATLLLKQSFLSFSAENQARLLEWMDRGISSESIQKWLEVTSQPVTEESIVSLSDIWRRDHLAILDGQLPENYQRTLNELVTKTGTPRALDVPRVSEAGAFGPESPKTVEELEAMEAEALSRYLASWPPSAELFAPNAEGLGRNLTTVISKRPEYFAQAACSFRTLDPTYVRAFLLGLHIAVKDKKVLVWDAILDLSLWAARQPKTIPERKGAGLFVADPDWGWTRNEILDLFSSGFDVRLAGHFIADHRGKVWEIIYILLQDPNPAPRDEVSDPQQAQSAIFRTLRKDAPVTELDPATLAVNTTRGRAMRVVFQYARWLRLLTDEDRKARGEQPMTFEEMPEVKNVLDNHLDTAAEPTRTVRSVYGDHLHLAAWLDKAWVLANLPRIFPLAADREIFFRAAWNSFILYGGPIVPLMPALIPYYQRAEFALAETSPKNAVRSTSQSLGEHLMVYYWYDAIDLESEDGLLATFFSSAPPDVRGHAMWFVGTNVASWKDRPPEQVFLRLRNLFEMRLKDAVGSDSPETFRQELVNFGHWFVSEKFDDEWSVGTLIRALRVTKKVEPSRHVIQRLEELSPKYPFECVSALRLMVEGDTDGWLFVGVEEKAQSLLQTALASGMEETVRAAKRLIEDLIARGQFGFQALAG